MLRLRAIAMPARASSFDGVIPKSFPHIGLLRFRSFVPQMGGPFWWLSLSRFVYHSRLRLERLWAGNFSQSWANCTGNLKIFAHTPQYSSRSGEKLPMSGALCSHFGSPPRNESLSGSVFR